MSVGSRFWVVPVVASLVELWIAGQISGYQGAAREQHFLWDRSMITQWELGASRSSIYD